MSYINVGDIVDVLSGHNLEVVEIIGNGDPITRFKTDPITPPSPPFTQDEWLENEAKAWANDDNVLMYYLEQLSPEAKIHVKNAAKRAYLAGYNSGSEDYR